MNTVMSATGYRHIGKPTVRKDAAEIVTGTARFIDDIKVPGMLFAKVLRSPHAHANIRRIDTTKAEGLSGVKAVLTYKNVPDWKGGIPVPHRRVLDSRVRFVGDGVAVVAAASEEIAEEALDLVKVEYELLPAVYDVDEAVKPGAVRLYDEYANNILPAGCPFFGPTHLKEIVRGDVEKGFQEADVIAEGTYAYENFPNPLPPEPPGVIVWWDRPDKINVISSSQCPNMVKMKVGRYMGFPEFRSIAAHCGGSYGSKNTPWMLVFYAGALARVTRRPVKLYYTKEEHFASYGLRVGSRIHARVGMKKDGTVTAFAGEWLADTGAFSDMTQGEMAVGCGEAQMMMGTCSNWNFTTKTVVTNRNPAVVVRGFGGQELKSSLIPLWTMAMEKADLDPFEVFKRNYVRPGNGYFWRDGKWYVCNGIDHRGAMERGAEVFGWKEKWKGWMTPTAVVGSKRWGVGVGVHGNADVGEDESEADVRLCTDGRVILHCCVAEAGQGERSNLCKMVAEVLNLPLERVSMTDPDSMVNPFEFGIAGSRGTYAIGSAVIAAAEDVRRQLLELAAQKLGSSPEFLDTRDGLINVKDSTREVALPWVDILGPTRTLVGHGRFHPDYSRPNCLMTFVEVMVDVETGRCDLVRVVQATDVGQIIDPLILNGQLYGGIGSAGIDTALFEETVWDKRTGRIMNPNMIDYKWRTFPDLPIIENVILETPISTHRFKAVGAGEISTSPGPSAVLMAISNAIGKRIKEYPATPDRILRALGKVEER
ncbi:MAG: molybdopterin cofactor-binding domain-containing protein [Thermodesulfobacteriota bacterium]